MTEGGKGSEAKVEAPKKEEAAVKPIENQTDLRQNSDRQNISGAKDISKDQKGDHKNVDKRTGRPDITGRSDGRAYEKDKFNKDIKGEIIRGNELDTEKNNLNEKRSRIIVDGKLGRQDISNRNKPDSDKTSETKDLKPTKGNEIKNDNIATENKNTKENFPTERDDKAAKNMLARGQVIANQVDVDKNGGFELNTNKKEIDSNLTKENSTEFKSENKIEEHIVEKPKLSKAEKAERQKIMNTDDRFPFEYDKSSESSKVSNIWDKVFLNIKSKLESEGYKIILQCYSSSPGSVEYNEALAEKRGATVKDYLVANGVDESRIEIAIKGEPNYPDVEDKDFADDRVVIPTFEKIADKDMVDPDEKYKSIETLEQDINKGEEKFLKKANQIVEIIKKYHHLEPFLFLDAPSDDPKEFLKQFKGLSKETIEATKDPVKMGILAAKMAIDGVIDFTSGTGVSEISKARDRKYDVLIEAMTSALFPSYKVGTKNYDPEEKLIFNLCHAKFSQMSGQEKYNVKAYFIAGNIFGMNIFTSSERFKNHWNTSEFKKNARHFFNQSEYRYRD